MTKLRTRRSVETEEHAFLVGEVRERLHSVREPGGVGDDLAGGAAVVRDPLISDGDGDGRRAGGG